MGKVRSFEQRLREPTGKVTNPLILLEGGELTGKTFSALLLSCCVDRIGRYWMVQLGEVDGDQYGAIVDAQGRKARFQLAEHDGTWADIVATVEQAVEAAEASVAAGEKTPVLLFDSASIEWEMLSAWADARARTSKAAKAILAADPNAEIETKHVHWNAANRRHKRLMTLFKRFPGIVILTARGKPVSKFNDKGQAVANQKDYAVEAQKGVGYASTACVRLSKEEPPTIVGARLANGGIMPGEDPPLRVGRGGDERTRGVRFSVEWLIFDFLGYEQSTAGLRPSTEPVVDAEPDLADLAEEQGVSERYLEQCLAIDAADTQEELTAIWETIKAEVATQVISYDEGARLKDRLKGRAASLPPVAAPTPAEDQAAA